MNAETTQLLPSTIAPTALTHTGRGVRSYALAVAAGLVAFGFVLLIEWITGDLVVQPALLAVLVAAWYGGLIPGLLALVVTVGLMPTFAVFPHSADHELSAYLTPTLVVIPLGILTAVFGHEGRSAVASLRRSEHLFEAFMSNLPGAAWMKDTTGRYAYANDEAVRVFKTTRNDLLGKNDEQVFPVETAQQFTENDRLALSRRESVQTVEALEHDDGIHQSLVVKFPVFDGPNTVGFVGGVAIDITDRHRAEQELAKRSEQLQLVIDAVPALVSYIDRDHRYIFNSKGYEDWFGTPAADMAGKPMAEVLGQEAYESIRGYLHRALSGEVVEYEALVPYRDGGARWIEAQYVPDRDRHGAVVGLFALVLDVTTRKQLEIERTLLAEVTARLSESLHVEQTARGLVTGLVPDFVDGAVVYFAPSGDSRDGVSVTARRLADAHGMDGATDPVTGTYAGGADAASIEAERGVAAVFRTARPEFYRRAPDDFELPLAAVTEGTASPEAGPRTSMMLAPIIADGEVLAVIATWTDRPGRTCEEHDFTLLQEIARRAGLAIRHSLLYEESRRIAEELLVANNAKDEFLGTVSHELRTPITVILGNAALLANRHQQMDQETIAASLGDLLGQAERLHRVVENMLILARLESDAGAVEAEPMLIARSISQVVAEAQRQQPGRVIRLESSDWDLFALGTESYVHQVLLNYINNAMRYSPAPQPVDIAVHLVGDEVRVQVLDRGIGVADEDLEGLFKPFYRSQRTPDEAGGMGIGLSVSKRLIEALGGSVWAQQRVDGGAEFGFSLPAATTREPGESELSPAGHSSAVVSAGADTDPEADRGGNPCADLDDGGAQSDLSHTV